MNRDLFAQVVALVKQAKSASSLFSSSLPSSPSLSSSQAGFPSRSLSGPSTNTNWSALASPNSQRTFPVSDQPASRPSTPPSGPAPTTPSSTPPGNPKDLPLDPILDPTTGRAPAIRRYDPQTGQWYPKPIIPKYYHDQPPDYTPPWLYYAHSDLPPPTPVWRYPQLRQPDEFFHRYSRIDPKTQPPVGFFPVPKGLGPFVRPFEAHPFADTPRNRSIFELFGPMFFQHFGGQEYLNRQNIRGPIQMTLPQQLAYLAFLRHARPFLQNQIDPDIPEGYEDYLEKLRSYYRGIFALQDPMIKRVLREPDALGLLPLFKDRDDYYFMAPNQEKLLNSDPFLAREVAWYLAESLPDMSRFLQEQRERAERVRSKSLKPPIRMKPVYPRR